MKWHVDRARKMASTECGYEIRWAKSSHGNFFNAYAPSGQHIEAAYDLGKCKAACDAHARQGELAV